MALVAVNDWDKQDNQWGGQGLVYMLPASAPLKEQLTHAEGVVGTMEGLANKNKSQSKGRLGGVTRGREEAKYLYKTRIARDHVNQIKKKMEKPAPAAQKKPAPANPAPMNKEAIKTAAFGTEAQLAAAEKTDSQKEAFDRTVAGIGLAKDGVEMVKTFKAPLKTLEKNAGLIEARDGAGFGELQQIVQFALAVRIASPPSISPPLFSSSACW